MTSSPVIIVLVGLFLAGDSAVQDGAPKLESFVIKDLVPEFYFARSAPVSTRIQILGNPNPRERHAVLFRAKGPGFSVDVPMRIPGTGELVIPGKGEGVRTLFARSGGEELSRFLFEWYGAEHVFTGLRNPVRLGSYTFHSDPQYPLVFKVERVRGKGYYYICGRGTVTKDGEKPVRLGYDHTADMWLPCLKKGDQLQREGASQALGWIGNKDCIPALIEALRTDRAWQVRRNAAESLGRLGGGKEVADALFAAAKDEHFMVVAVAAESLGKLGKTGFPYLVRLLSDERCRQDAIYGLGASGLDEAAPELAKILDDDTDPYRPEALAALANLKRPGCLGPVLRALEDSDEDVVQAAIEAAVALGDPQAVPALRKLASKAAQPEIRKAAQKAVEKLSQPK